MEHVISGIGFCARDVDLQRLPGWEPHSYGYHGDDGFIFPGVGRGHPYGPTFTKGARTSIFDVGMQLFLQSKNVLDHGWDQSTFQICKHPAECGPCVHSWIEPVRVICLLRGCCWCTLEPSWANHIFCKKWDSTWGSFSGCKWQWSLIPFSRIQDKRRRGMSFFSFDWFDSYWCPRSETFVCLHLESRLTNIYSNRWELILAVMNLSLTLRVCGLSNAIKLLLGLVQLKDLH